MVVHTLKKDAKSVWQKLGFYQWGTLVHPIHFHCVSVGEFNACKPLITALHQSHPIIITSTTATGYQAVAEYCQDKENIAQYYFPFDIPFAVKRFLGRTQPILSVMFETEIWVNFNAIAKRNNIKLALINARLSVKSFKKYQWFSMLTKRTLNCFDMIATQNELSSQHFKALGYTHPYTLPSIKFDVDTRLNTSKQQEVQMLLKGKKALVCASTHANEEEMILSAYLEKPREYVLVLIPRHPQRFAEVEKLLRTMNVSYIKQSTPTYSDTQVILADSMGYVREYYAHSFVAFVGGSLVDHVGGHNMLEAMAFDTLVVSGKHTFNFVLSADLAAQKSLIIIEDAFALCTIADAYYQENTLYQNYIDNAKISIKKNKGTLLQLHNYIQQLINPTED